VTPPTIGSILNLRDVGGLRTGDGRAVRPGLLYRSATPFFLVPEDARRLTAEFKIRTRIDLRSSREIADGTSAHLTAVEQHVAHLPLSSGSRWVEDITITDQAERVSNHYLRFLEHAADSVVEVVTLLADPDRLPVLVHCTAGKDRTGVAIAMALSAVGVLDDEIVADYALTRDQLDDLMAQLRSIPTYADRIADLPAESLSAEPESMALFLRRMAEQHGGAAAYLLGRGVTATTIERLGTSLLGPDPSGASRATRHD
jgi:protein-tyrosine phosphatase